MSSDYVSHSRSTQQQPVTAQVDLSFDEVANHFPFPIAEAASNLGVSTNDLKRVCRGNGLSRWPYRKILAGKTVEDVKKEAAREMAILERMSRLQPQPTSNTLNTPRPNRLGAYIIGTSAVSASTEKDASSIDILKRQTAGPVHGLYAHASSLKPLQIDQRPQLLNQFHLRVNIPTYLDEFKQGFPSEGLSSASVPWWGGASSDEADDSLHVKDRQNGSEETCSEGRANADRKPTRIRSSSSQPADLGTTDVPPASLLARTRQHAVETGRKALGIHLTRGYGAHRLADKDETLLRAVFGESFPRSWESLSAANQHG